MGQRAKGAVCGGVAVTADHSHARQGPALFGANDMHDPLTHIGHRVIVNTEILGVLVQRGHLDGAVFGHVLGVFTARRGRHVVVRHGNGFLWCPHFAARHAQPFEGLRAGHLVHKVTVDIEQTGAVFGLMGDVGIPDFVIKRFGGHGSSPICRGFGGWLEAGVYSLAITVRAAPKNRSRRRAWSCIANFGAETCVIPCQIQSCARAFKHGTRACRSCNSPRSRFRSMLS